MGKARIGTYIRGILMLLDEHTNIRVIKWIYGCIRGIQGIRGIQAYKGHTAYKDILAGRIYIGILYEYGRTRPN
jgi:hypothetical protein